MATREVIVNHVRLANYEAVQRGLRFVVLKELHGGARVEISGPEGDVIRLARLWNAVQR